jgi:hypothetical protein
LNELKTVGWDNSLNMQVTVVYILHTLYLASKANDGSLRYSDEYLPRGIPNLDIIVTMSNLDLDVLLVDERRIVGGDHEILGGVIGDGAVEVGSIQALAPHPVS